MIGDKPISNTDPPFEPLNPAAASASVPLIARLAHQIHKPMDWPALQRNCVLLFRSELKDPNALEYGRSGQNQGGIDILGKRNGDTNHYVGIQCRRIDKPIKKKEILKDCKAALALKANLKEIIFATTAPNDTGATNDAIVVERQLRDEGHDLTVVVYGWEALQILIANHEDAYAAFCPSILATSAPQTPATAPSVTENFAGQVAAHVVEQLRCAASQLSAERSLSPFPI